MRHPRWIFALVGSSAMFAACGAPSTGTPPSNNRGSGTSASGGRSDQDAAASTTGTGASNTSSGAGNTSGSTSTASDGSDSGGGSSAAVPDDAAGGLPDAATPPHDAAPAPDATRPDGSSGPAGVYAFPGALGFGRSGTGGRGGTVVHVTNLNDAGPGSLRDAVSAGHRIVVFDVGGYITVSSAISVASNVTIAGQTAPGAGVGVRGNELSFSAQSNIVVRYIRVRPGCTVCTNADPSFKRSGINLAGSTTAIFDHVSIEFAQWNNIDAVGATNITVQHSIDADPIGQQFAAHTEGGPFTWFGNLFANTHNRNPLAKADTQYVNNVVYDYQLGYTAGNTAGTFRHDLVSNYFISGPATSNAGDAFFQVNNQPIFDSNNDLDGNGNGTLDGSPLGVPAGAVTLAAAWSPATATLPAVTPVAAYTAVLAGAGASLHRDEVDALVVSQATSLGKTGQLYTSPVQTGLADGGFGALAGGTAPFDTDGDGMPDAWETHYGLNPNSPADANGDFDHSGYTNIEKYINGLTDGSYPTP